MEFGRHIAEGLAIGIDRHGGQAAAALRPVSDELAATGARMRDFFADATRGMAAAAVGTGDFRDALKGVGLQFAELAATEFFQHAFKGIGSNNGGAAIAGGGEIGGIGGALARIGSSLVNGLRSFEGGGYTGGGARSGGVDGKGGFPAILHPDETGRGSQEGNGRCRSDRRGTCPQPRAGYAGRDAHKAIAADADPTTGIRRGKGEPLSIGAPD